jgi:pimeloyl-ACP methyl ester carboxylesterase
MQHTGPPLRFATTRLATGPQVHYAEQGDPGGDPIVFIHPHADSWFSFSRVLSLLPARYHAYALDQRGHGDSERPACCYTIDDFAADIVAFLDGVGITRATLVGHSASGFIARRVAQTHPDRVTRLVLINCAVALPEQVRREMQAAVREFRDPLPVEFVRELHASVAYVPLPEPVFERLVAQSLKAPARVWQAALEGLLGFDDAAELGRIVAPTLLLWGERDGLFSREEQERLAAAIPGARLQMVPETGHSPHLERPERVADGLDAFMRA